MVCSLRGHTGSQEWCDAHESMGNVILKQEARLEGTTRYQAVLIRISGAVLLSQHSSCLVVVQNTK